MTQKKAAGQSEVSGKRKVKHTLPPQTPVDPTAAAAATNIRNENLKASKW